MNKASLLRQLAQVRKRAEAAHLETVMQSQVITRLDNEGRNTHAAKAQLNKWKMAEQKLLLEMNWVMDQLDDLKR
jgi:hypothetical protein